MCGVASRLLGRNNTWPSKLVKFWSCSRRGDLNSSGYSHQTTGLQSSRERPVQCFSGALQVSVSVLGGPQKTWFACWCPLEPHTRGTNSSKTSHRVIHCGGNMPNFREGARCFSLCYRWSSMLAMACLRDFPRHRHLGVQT